MSFWENASGATKGIIVVGGVLIVVLLGMMGAGVGPFDDSVGGEAATQERGLGQAQ